MHWHRLVIAILLTGLAITMNLSFCSWDRRSFTDRPWSEWRYAVDPMAEIWAMDMVRWTERRTENMRTTTSPSRRAQSSNGRFEEIIVEVFS